MFSEVSPKLAVYSHLVMLRGPTIPEAPLPSLITRTRTNYDGPLVIGEDLMSFIIGESVDIYRAARYTKHARIVEAAIAASGPVRSGHWKPVDSGIEPTG